MHLRLPAVPDKIVDYSSLPRIIPKEGQSRADSLFVVDPSVLNDSAKRANSLNSCRPVEDEKKEKGI